MTRKTPRLILIAAMLMTGVVTGRAAVLRHHYPLDTNGDDQSGVTHLIPTGNSVTFQPTGGKAGGFLQLGGTDDYLLAAAGSNFSALGDYDSFRPFSMSFWVRQTASQASSGTVAVFGMTTNSTVTASVVPNHNTGFEVATRESSAGLGLRVRCRNGNSGDGTGALVTGINIADGTWHHVVAVFEAGGRSVYLDGALVGSSSTPVAFAAGEPITKFSIGSFIRAGSPLDDLNGDVDDFQVYEGAVTALEALQLYQNPGSNLNDDLPPPDTTDVLPPDTPLADVVDTMIGVAGGAGTGSTVPGPCLPQSSIYPSPDTVAAAAGGFAAGSNVVGFSQLHATGAGSSTMSYGNFLVSPRIGANTSTREDDNGSPVTNVVARPYSYRGRLTTPGVDCTVVPTANCAIYQFDFPTSSDARLYFDVARKLNGSTALTSGSVQVDLANGTISGGGGFDGNWSPAAYNLYFYAKLDGTPSSGGTWINNTPTDGVLAATTATRQRIGSWVRFDTRTNRTVRMKIGVSFQSVEKARQYVENEIPAWDLTGLETAAKSRWNDALSAVRAPGISKGEARKLYTALFHSLIQPRDRTGDPAGWAADAPFWDDQYTPWDTWQTLYPLLGIIRPASVASIVNSFGERYAHNGRAETAFIMGKEFQVGQGGDEVDRIIADAWVKKISGIDWAKIWPLLKFNAGRRTPDYINLGFVSTDGSKNGYDSRMSSASSTLAFAHGDWCAAQVAAGLGLATEAQALLARSANWRNVWDASLVGDGFSGFVRGRSRSGAFTTTPPTGNVNDFYQGTCWNYSFNIFDRDAMMALMGGRARFIQRLEFAFGQNSTSYLDFGNEVNLQAVPLLSRVSRPNLAAYWADNVRQRYGANTYPGDEDSGAMASLYFFLSAGFVPAATEDTYYLHGPRVPRLEFKVGGGKSFTIIAENAGGPNIYVQSATLDGQPLDHPVIRHADIMAGRTLAFVMGPNPSDWGTGGDFTTPARRDFELPVNGPWTASLGSPSISEPSTDSPVWGSGSNGADDTAIHSPFPQVTLGQTGSSITLTARVKFNGLAASQTAPSARFAWGLFNANDPGGAIGWPGYLAANDRVNASGRQLIWRKNAGDGTSYHSASGAATLTSFSLPVPPFTDDTYRLALTLTRTAANGLDYHAALIRVSDNVLFAQFSGSDPAPATFTFNRVGLRAGDALDADSLEVIQCGIIANSVGTAPAVEITAPTEGSTFSTPEIINVTAATTSSPHVAVTFDKVEFFAGADKIGESTVAPYGMNWSGMAAGTYSLTARASDDNGNAATSNAVTVTVNTPPGSGTLVRGPYLQMARPTGMTLRWRSSQAVAGRVKYGTSPGNLTHTVNEDSDATDHVIDLTGLSPSTTYYYSIGSAFDTLLGDATTTFTTPPSAGTAVNTRVWVLGDAGTGNNNQSAVRDAFYNWTGSRTPDLVLQLGDNAYNNGTDEEFQGAMFNMYDAMLKKTPFWSCLGNHETGQSADFVDTYPYFDIYTLPAAGECGGVPSGTEHYYSFDYGNIHFISIDSMTASRSPTGAMAAWLTQDLASTTATWIVAFFHHPPYTKGSHDSDTETRLIEMRTNILPILENGGVDLVLNGHSHSYERSYLLDGHYGLSTTFDNSMKKNAGDGRPEGMGAYVKPLTGPRDHFGAVYSVAGSSGQVSGGPLNHPAHFLSLNNLGSLVLDVNGTRLDATFVRENGTTPDTFTIIKRGAADTDGDGISDAYEIAHGLNRYVSDAADGNDADGLSNMLEFAFGLNPNSNDAFPVEVDVGGSLLTRRGTPVPWYQTTTNGTDLRFIFIRRKNAAEEGLIYTPQFSRDLVNWQDSNVTPTVIAEDGEMEAVSISYPFFLPDKNTRFFRVSVGRGAR